METPTPNVPATRRRCLLACVASGCLIGFAAAAAAEVGRVAVGTNENCILDGRAYRSAQRGEQGLRGAAERHGIRTIVNLRGYCPDFDWYVEESRAGHDLGICQEDITLSANRWPPPPELARLIEVLDRTEYPILIHCRRGSDRTGLVAAIILLLHSDADLATARRQCSPRYGHFRFLTTARLDEFFDQYELWLRDSGREHTPALFRHWVLNDYSPGPARADLMFAGAPRVIHRVGEAPRLRIKAVNHSPFAWQMLPGTLAGVHARFILSGPAGGKVAEGRAGQFAASVPPGGEVEMTVALPRLAQPGPYRVLIDLVGPRQMSFMQAGVKPLELEMYAGE